MITNKIWQPATLLTREMIATDIMSLTFSLPEWIPFESGQHYDIRLTAPGGYMAERSYSIASSPEKKDSIEFGVQLLPGGEVSPYLYKLPIGKQVEIRGPIGGHFIWNTREKGPLILIAGGSGMVPLMSMLRHHINHFDEDVGRDIIFLISVRSYDHLLWKKELEEIGRKDRNINIVVTLTDEQPQGWGGYKRRIDKPMLEEILGECKDKQPKTYICGPTPFVEAVSQHMVRLGFKAEDVKTERFGG